MQKRHPESPNLHLHASDSFYGMPVLSGSLPMVTEYLEALHSTLQKALLEYPRVFAVRVEPVIPTEINNRMTIEDHQLLIRAFTASLRAIIKHDRQRRRQFGWAPNTRLRYAWCREVYKNDKPHYHFFLIFNRDAYHNIGSPGSPDENLANRISRAWHSALGLEWNRHVPLIHVPVSPQFWIDRGNLTSLDNAFKRASYMCKADTKRYGDGMRSFGTSRN